MVTNVTKDDSTRLGPGQEDTGPLQQQNMGSSRSSSFPSSASEIISSYARFKQRVLFRIISSSLFLKKFFLLFFFSFTVLFIKTRCFDPVNLQAQSAWDATDMLPSH